MKHDGISWNQSLWSCQSGPPLRDMLSILSIPRRAQPVRFIHSEALHYFAYKSRRHRKWRSCPFWHRTRPVPRRSYRRSRRFPGARGKSSHNLRDIEQMDGVLLLHPFARRNEKARSVYLYIYIYICVTYVYVLSQYIRRPESACSRIILCKIQTVQKIQNPKSKIRNPKSKIQNPKSKIQNPKSKIQNPKSKIQNPKSKIQNPKSKIQTAAFGAATKRMDTTTIQNPKSKIQDPKSKIQNPRSKIQNPKSKIQNPKSKIQNPKSKIQNPRSKIQNPKSKIQDPKSKIQNPKSKIQTSKLQNPKSKRPVWFGFWILEFGFGWPGWGGYVANALVWMGWPPKFGVVGRGSSL